MIISKKLKRRSPSEKVKRRCKNCKEIFLVEPSRLRRSSGIYCSKDCYRNLSLVDRFKAFLGRPDKNGCINWQGVTCNGYGQISNKGKQLKAHRVAWELKNGPIKKGYSCLHKCDNRSCVNVDHLFIGTQLDNMRDMIEKGRHKTVKGDDHPNAKLSKAKIKKIRQRYFRYGFTQLEISEEFGISRPLVSMIVNHKIWRHVE